VHGGSAVNCVGLGFAARDGIFIDEPQRVHSDEIRATHSRRVRPRRVAAGRRLRDDQICKA
jgi:hypothetical protein